MAIPFGSLQAQRSRVLPQGGAVLGQLAGSFQSGLEAGRLRAAEDQAPNLIMDYLDTQASGYQPQLGALMPATGYVGGQQQPTQADPAMVPGSPMFNGGDAMRTARQQADAGIPQPPPVSNNYAANIAGYGSGLNTTGLDATFGSGLDRAIGAYIAQGGNPADIQINSLVRSTAEQADLYRRYQAGEIGLAAPPGQSRHEYGAAADIQSGPFLDWLHQNAGNYGLSFLTGNAFTNDPGHVQLAGPSPAGTRAPAIPAGGGSMPASGGGYSSQPAWTPPTGQERALLRAMIVNPVTRQMGIELTTQRMMPPQPQQPNWQIQEVNGTLYRIDANSGQVQPLIQGPGPQPDYGWVNVPGVGLVRTDDTTGTAETVMTPPEPGPDFNNEEALRDNFRAETSDYRLVEGHYARLQAAAADPSAAGDIAMVYAFMKMLDPGSVVRETEYATAQNAAGVPDIVRNLWNRVLSGERLGEDQRADFLTQAGNTFRATQNVFNQTVERYRNLAIGYQMDPDRVLGVGGVVPPSVTPGEGGVAPEGTIVQMQDGTLQIKQNGQWVPYGG